eukprot:g2344.t1
MDQPRKRQKSDSSLQDVSNLPHRPTTKVPTENGIITQVVLKNFMCHKHLVVELGPHLNFITGRNGSGKSAIIAGIQICLGARAADTSRGKSIRNLVRKGCLNGKAMCSCVLKNVPSRNQDGSKDLGGTYRHDKYDDFIRIERHFDKSGSSSFKTFNHTTGKIVSRQKSEVDEITRVFNVQVKNPVCIMEQQMTKEFLFGSPEAKYQFFLKATYLEKFDLEIQATKGHIKRTKRVLEQVGKDMPYLKQQRDDLHEKVLACTSLDRLQKEIDQLEDDQVWALLYEKEDVARGELKKTEKYQKALDKRKAKIEKKRTKFDAVVSKREELTETMRNHTEKIGEVAAEKKKVANRLQEQKRLERAITNKLKELKKEQSLKRNEVKRILKELNEVMAEVEEENDELLQEKVKLEKEIQMINEQSKILDQRISEADNIIYDMERKFAEAKKDVSWHREKYNNTSKRLAALKRQSRGGGHSAAAVYGQNLPDLLKLIERNKRHFNRMPLGPLGLHIKLKDKQWGKAVEANVKQVLSSFVVHNNQDRKVFNKLRKQARCSFNEANVIMYNLDRPRLELPASKIPSKEFLSVLDVLVLPNNLPVVRNILIDSCSSERVVLDTLDPNSNESTKKYFGSRQKPFRLPENVKSVIFVDGTKMEVKNGSKVLWGADQVRERCLIGTDLSAMVESVEREVADLRKVCEASLTTQKAVEQEVRNLKKKIGKDKMSQRSFDSKVRGLKKKLRGVISEFEKIESKKEERENGQDPEMLRAEKEAAMDEIRQLEEKQAEERAKYTPIGEEQVKIKKTLEELNAKQDAISEKADECKSDLSELNGAASKLKDDIQNLTHEYEEHLISHKEMKTEAAANIEKVELLINEQVEQEKKKDTAFEKPNRSSLPGRGDSKKIEKIKGTKMMELEACKKHLNVGDPVKLQSDYAEADLKYREKKSELDEKKRTIEKLEKSVKKRELDWKKFRKMIASETSRRFNNFMCDRGSVGKVKFDHSKNELSIKVSMNANQEREQIKASQVNDTRQLSGGERSYLTMSLLLALGESVECPFRIMDEFDVFMDASNRNLSIGAIVNAAERKWENQYILITPLSLSELRKHDPGEHPGCDSRHDLEHCILNPKHVKIITMQSHGGHHAQES